MGTHKTGLWRSTNRGLTWSKVESFPDVGNAQSNPDPDAWGKQDPGIVMVVFDPSDGIKGRPTKTIYVAASLMGRDNLFVSNDAGMTWSSVKNQPVQYRPTHMVLASDGNLYLTYGDNPGPFPMTNGGVWKFNTKLGRWTEITPDKPAPEKNIKFGNAAVSVDAHHPQNLIVSSYYRPGRSGGDDIFRSTDGGKRWKPIFKSGSTFDYSLAPYVANTPLHWFFDKEIDPADPAHAMFTTGYGGWETFNLTDIDAGRPVRWSIMARGIEETVPLALLSPPKGVQLFTAVGDYCGFAHKDLDKPQPEGCFLNPHFGNTNDIACAEKNPDVIVRVGKASSHIPGAHIGYSLDGGKTWQPPVSVPDKESKLGFIAVSSDGASWIWTPDRSASYVTHDKGATWNLIRSLPENIRVIADRVNSNKCYARDLFSGKFFISQDRGDSFIEQSLNLPGGYPKSRNNRGDDRGGQDRVYATPGYEGDLWIAAFDGLYHSTNTGKVFERINGVQEMHGFGFGKAAPHSKYPALYMVGTINGQRGIFRSDDAAENWVRINDDQHQWGLILHVTGDPKKYGRVYVGTHGRGTVYGDPVP